MRRKFLRAIAALTVSAFATASAFIPSIVSAEHEKAAEIRDIFQSEKYYIEYEINRKEDKRALAVDGNVKKSFDCEGRRSSTLLSYVPIVGFFAKGSLKLMPEVLYKDGNYYQFIEKKKALRANEAEMNDPYINPSQEWNTIPLRIQLPEELGMFTGDSEISFVESGTKIIDEAKNKSVAFDKYVKPIKNVDGVNIAKKVYVVYYAEDGSLDKILTLSVDWDVNAGQIVLDEEGKKTDQQNYEIQTLRINKLTRELPQNVMSFPNGCKVYGPGLGDMNEIIDQPPLLEEFKSTAE